MHRLTTTTVPATSDQRRRGRGQVAGIGWAHAEAAALLASNGSDSLQGLRDAAIIRVMSDTLPRISEVATLRCADVEADASGGGTVLIRASKSDQQGEGSTRYIGPATLAAVQRYLEAAGHSAGALFRQVRRGGHASDDPLGADSIRAIVRRRAAAVDGIAGRIGGHSLRVGSAPRSRSGRRQRRRTTAGGRVEVAHYPRGLHQARSSGAGSGRAAPVQGESQRSAQLTARAPPMIRASIRAWCRCSRACRAPARAWAAGRYRASIGAPPIVSVR